VAVRAGATETTRAAAQAALLRSLPQVEELLRKPTVLAIADQLPQAIVVDSVRDSIAAVRAEILAGKEPTVDADVIAEDARRRLLGLGQPSLRPVINLTGIILHTNLGRSVLAADVIDAVAQVAAGYSTLEYDTATQGRGSRHQHYQSLVCALTGAEAAIAVNNNAAAVMMVLSEFAAGHEAIVSRGELVEIGGSFRVPDIMRLSRAVMVEVGTTNKTHLSDYQRALSQDTRMLLKVHPSNYHMVGFTESVSIKELCQLAERHNAQRGAGNAPGADNISSSGNGSGVGNGRTGDAVSGQPASLASDGNNGLASGYSDDQSDRLLVYQDLGSGALLPLEIDGQYEPTVRESLAQGCDLVSFSADKLLGGPQAGIIVGKKPLIDRLKQSPLARVLRLDKLTLTALEVTLRHYLNAEQALREIPTLRMLSEPIDSVRQRAERLEQSLQGALADQVSAGRIVLSTIPEVTRAGGGSLPMCDIDTYVVRIDFLTSDAQDCERYLISQRHIPIITRIKKQSLLCDVRTVTDESEIAETAAALRDYFNSLPDGTAGGGRHRSKTENADKEPSTADTGTANAAGANRTPSTSPRPSDGGGR
jgi:L-seryl-tRNA(Ser) seleniumtransferase